MAVTETRSDAMPLAIDIDDSPRALSASALRERAQRHGR